jgi:hypothetical protein
MSFGCSESAVTKIRCEHSIQIMILWDTTENGLKGAAWINDFKLTQVYPYTVSTVMVTDGQTLLLETKTR